MLAINNGKKRVIILLHEIYGVNDFMRQNCDKFARWGYDVYCPDMTGRGNPYSYDRQEEAYAYFICHGGFTVFTEINKFAQILKERYEKVFIVGFSVGATVAWRCAQTGCADGVAGYYGSRIRDYADVAPVCPVLLLYGSEESFDVPALAEKLKPLPQTEVMVLQGGHGFADAGSGKFHAVSAAKAEEAVFAFLEKCK